MTVLLACLVVVMVGFGVALPVLPFCVKRLLQAGGSEPREVATQIGLLTGLYPLMQLVSAPFWGRWSDSVTRKASGRRRDRGCSGGAGRLRVHDDTGNALPQGNAPKGTAVVRPRCRYN
jgi:MFS family permease